MPTPSSRILAAAVLLTCVGTAAGQAPAETPTAIDPALYSKLKWRNIGPFRGGRCTAVAGVASATHTYYFGACGGGLWKTVNAGHSWTNLSDKHFKTGSIGAIAVAASDPNVLYVGTGEAPVRGVTTTHGDGVYRSTDRGRSFHKIGLDATRHISAIRVHPHDPDTAWVAAQGNPWGPSPHRGVYRTRDGGKTWTHVLQGNAHTGAASLSLDATNPRILYATMWDHHRQPWQIRSGGPGSAIHKSVDGGDTWVKLEKGLPKGIGKAAIAVSPADPDRVYAIVEAANGGLYRSDNAGETWQLINAKRVLRARAWYYMHIFADPKNADTVYVLNAPMMKSIDGGKTFTQIRTPHGDNHDLWINPTNPALMVEGNDGGANVSLDGGKSWSTQNNQATAQFYRVNTDDRFPFWVYGGQQDNTTVAIKSRSFDSGIGAGDWFSVGGGESAHVAFDPKNPRLIYATSILGTITEFDRRTGHARSVMPYPQFVLGADARDYRFRYNWNPPVLVSQHDPKTIYFGAQALLRSENRGTSWSAVSPDLTRNEDAKHVRGGVPYTNEAASAEIYNTIFYIAESPHEKGTLWVGTDCGLVHRTQDAGKTWRNVTPAGLGETQINAIEVSSHTKGKAWLAVTGYKLGDFTPHIYCTRDAGETWEKHVRGIPMDTFVRVVREDPEREGLVYAGTEAGVFVSFDDGAHWQSLQLNLPPVPITDLMIRQGSLVAATQGRAFWILDDLSPLHAANASIVDATHYLYPCRKALRLMRRGGFTSKPGTNPNGGAVIRSFFKQAPEVPVAIEILDAEGIVLRSFTSEENARTHAYMQNPESHRRKEKPYGSFKPKKGMNEIVWDLRREAVVSVPGHLIPSGWNGPRVSPGEYTVRLRVGEQTMDRPLVVADDPRREEPVDFTEYDKALIDCYACINQLHHGIVRTREARRQIRGLADSLKTHADGNRLRDACASLETRILAWEESVIQEQRETQQDVANFENRLSMQLMALMGLIDAGDPPLTAGAKERLSDLQKQWQAAEQELKELLEVEVGKLNETLNERGIGAVHVAR